MSICPHCQTENESGATACRACGKPIAAATPTGSLPRWLQAMNPEGQADDTVVAQAHTPAPPDEAAATGGAARMSPVADAAARIEAAQATKERDEQGGRDEATHTQAPARLTAEGRARDTVVVAAHAASSAVSAPTMARADRGGETPSFAMPTAMTGGTDTVIATQPTTTARPSGPPTVTPINETASFINEDDLPWWLRAFSEPEHTSTTTTDDDQAWMIGSSTPIGDEQEASDLAQSWQSSPRATPGERTSGGATFATPTARPMTVTKHERLITPLVPPTVVPQLAATPSPQSGAAVGVPVRLGAGRQTPAIATRASSSAQRLAIIAFVMALLVFLAVLTVFIVAPALRG